MAQVQSKAVKIPIAEAGSLKKKPDHRSGLPKLRDSIKGKWKTGVCKSLGEELQSGDPVGDQHRKMSSTAESARKLRSRETQILKRGKWFLQEREERGGADLKRQFPTVRDPKKGVRSLK